jgi:hypothetical protein
MNLIRERKKLAARYDVLRVTEVFSRKSQRSDNRNENNATVRHQTLADLVIRCITIVGLLVVSTNVQEN